MKKQYYRPTIDCTVLFGTNIICESPVGSLTPGVLGIDDEPAPDYSIGE